MMKKTVVFSALILTFILLSSIYSNQAFSAIFKCVDQGKVFYNDRPCPKSNKETEFKPKYASAVSIKPYTGKFKHNELVQKNIDLIEKKSRSALQTTMDRLGLKRSIGIIDIKVADRLVDRRSVLALAYTAEVHSVKRGMILFDPRYLSYKGYDVEKTLIHELTHAVLSDVLPKQYYKWPVWLKEGLSVWVAGQISDKEKHVVSSLVFSRKRPSTLINGLEGEHTFQDYYEDGVFFEYLENQYGIESIHKFIQFTILGETYQNAFSLAFEVDVPTLHQEARDYSKKKLNRYLVKSDYNEFQKIKSYAQRDKKSWEKAKVEYESFIKSYPNSNLVSNATYQLGRTYMRLNNYEEAIKQFDKVLFRHSSYLSLFNRSFYQKAYSLMKLGEKKQARKLFNQLLHLFPYDNYKKSIKKFTDEGLIPVY